MTGPHDSTIDAPLLREDRIEWRPRADGGADATVDLEAPRDLTEGRVDVASAALEGGRLRLVLWVRAEVMRGA